MQRNGVDCEFLIIENESKVTSIFSTLLFIGLKVMSLFNSQHERREVHFFGVAFIQE